MGLFSRKKPEKSEGQSRRSQHAAQAATLKHFEGFVATKLGVESYFEPATPREQAALLLVARDGEWTRRRVPDAAAGAQLANTLGIPFYEVVKTGYPDSMRQWNLRQQGR
ncbi:oxidoreductase [Changpingibacter yushuensis]|uniref:oxidoreductase n=1 Tax=Changpingibacter yushuensis TaxID=2758440 RepID=UPI0015F677A8|nr:oxidoreductase [Changpingibacter yushuensis]